MGVEPRPVPPRHVLRWFRQGLALSTRRPLEFIVLTGLLLPTGLFWNAMPQLALAPALLAFGVLLAYCAEHRSSFIAEIRRRSGTQIVRPLVAGLIGIPIVLLIALAMVMMSRVDQPTEAAAAAATMTSALHFEAGDILLVTLFLWFMALGPIVWLLMPLLILENLPFKLALRLSLKAFLRNLYLAIVTSATSLILVAAIRVSFLVFPAVAILCCTMYASYRDIFYGSEIELETASQKRATELAHEGGS